MSALGDLLRAEIRKHGPISFARFMERALYCPELGYYDRIAGTVGRAGDYFTSVSVGPLFGALLARQCADWLTALPGEPVRLVEAGAHDAQLAHDILCWVQRSRPDVWRRLEYWVLEPSARRQEWQRRKLAQFALPTRWVESWDCIPEREIRGVIFSNELLDAMPVHQLRWDADAKTWCEWGVGLEEDRFVWKRMPGGSPGVLAPGTDERQLAAGQAPPVVPAELLAVLPDGFTTEVCPQATAWWSRAALRLGAGYLLTFDYGLRGEEFLASERSAGTLRAYRAHHQSPDVLAEPGAQDLTAHVNFSALQDAGESAGLNTEGLWPQAVFLTRIVQAHPDAISSDRQTRQFQTLAHPNHLGIRFHVLVQSRGNRASG